MLFEQELKINIEIRSIFKIEITNTVISASSLILKDNNCYFDIRRLYEYKLICPNTEKISHILSGRLDR
jgi:hypothetical protein